MKALKYAAIAVAPIVLGWGVWQFMQDNQLPLPSELVYVDVTSGEIINLDRDRIKTIPAKNEKGERVLFPAYVNDQGQIFVHERYKESLQPLSQKHALKVDLGTLEVKGGG